MNRETDRCPDGWDAAQLLAYIEGELAAAEAGDVTEHLRACPYCRGELARLKRIDSILRTHPEAFHPDGADLCSFVKEGTDPRSVIVDHLKSCSQCREDADILREMMSVGHEAPREIPAMPKSLESRIRQLHAPPSALWHETLRGHVREWLNLRFGLPVLAMGTAAAILVVAVLVGPMWRAYEEHPLTVPLPTEEMSAPEDHSAPKEIPQDRGRVAEPESKVMERRFSDKPEAEMPGKPFQPPAFSQRAAPSMAFETEKKADRHGGEASTGAVPVSPKDAERHLLPLPPESRSLPSVPERLKTKQRGPVGAAMKVPAAAKPDAARVAAGVTVRIVDENGRDIPWLKYVPTAPGSAPHVALQDKWKGAPAPPAEELRKSRAKREMMAGEKDLGGSGYLILVRVLPSGDGFRVEAGLVEQASGEEKNKLIELHVSREQLPNVVNRLVSSLVELL